MTERKIEQTNSDRMVEKNRANVPQPERAGTGPESQTYEERTGVKVGRDSAQAARGEKKTDDRKTAAKASAPTTGSATADKAAEKPHYKTENDPDNPLHTRHR